MPGCPRQVGEIDENEDHVLLIEEPECTLRREPPADRGYDVCCRHDPDRVIPLDTNQPFLAVDLESYSGLLLDLAFRGPAFTDECADP